jgi:hypothetical protein
MMLTFGPSNVGTGNDGEAIMAYTGGAYEGIELLPKLAGKIGFLFRWLFGFEDSSLVAFPIISLGSVGAALGLMPKFEANGIIDGNVVAVFAAIGMCWSGYLSTHTAMLDSLGYRQLTSKDLVAHTIGGIVAGATAHWAYVGFVALGSLFSSSVAQTMPGDSWVVSEQHHLTTRCYSSTLEQYDDGTYRLNDWYAGEKDTHIDFTVNEDLSLNIRNAYRTHQGYVYVSINEKATGEEPFYAVFYPGEGYSKFMSTDEGVKMFVYVYVYNGAGKLIESGYYWFRWGHDPLPQMFTPDDLKDSH